MPDNSSPFDDPLADLYGKLPDPRHERGEDAPASGVPSSRRAAREARTDTGATASQPPITRPPAAEPAPPATAQARTAAQEPRAAAPQSRPAAQGTQTQTRPVPQQTRPLGGTSAAQQSRPAASGTLDDLFTGRRSIDDVGSVPPPSEKRRRRIGGWIAFVIVLAIVGGVVGGGIWAWNTFGTQLQGIFAPEEREDFEAGIANGEATITIVEGDQGQSVSQKLYDAGVTKAPTSLYDYLIETSTPFTFQPGVFRLQLQMSSEAVIAALRDPASRLENAAQLREGLTVEQTVAALAEQMQMPIEDFQAAVADPAAYGVAAPNLEGWLFPATYTFNPGATATDVVTALVNRTKQSLDENGVAEADRQRVLTTASIIEREARLPDDFFKVSRVIQNRLDQGMQLQMDSTAQYGYGELHEGTASTSEEAQFDDNPWNTYVVPGLPVGPISNPGDQAIDAAIHPAEGDWIYFVTVNLDTGETLFSATYEEHQAGIDQMIDWCRDHPDSGC